jgi:hypothetical protein
MELHARRIRNRACRNSVSITLFSSRVFTAPWRSSGTQKPRDNTRQKRTAGCVNQCYIAQLQLWSSIFIASPSMQIHMLHRYTESIYTAPFSLPIHITRRASSRLFTHYPHSTIRYPASQSATHTITCKETIVHKGNTAACVSSLD